MDVKGVRKENLARFVGKRLREIRLAKGLRQGDIQQKGVNARYYQRIEVGRVNLTLRSLEKLMSALNATVWDLFQKPGLKKERTKKAKR